MGKMFNEDGTLYIPVRARLKPQARPILLLKNRMHQSEPIAVFPGCLNRVQGKIQFLTNDISPDGVVLDLVSLRGAINWLFIWRILHISEN